MWSFLPTSLRRVTTSFNGSHAPCLVDPTIATTAVIISPSGPESTWTSIKFLEPIPVGYNAKSSIFTREQVGIFTHQYLSAMNSAPLSSESGLYPGYIVQGDVIPLEPLYQHRVVFRSNL